MSYEATREVIANYIKTNLTSVTVVPENRAFEPSSGQVWVRYGVRPNDQFASEVGGKQERVIGMIWFQIFLPENSGSAEAHKIGDTICGLFFQKYLTAANKPAVMCESAKLRYVGQEASGQQMWSVTVPYRVDAAVT